MDMALAQSNFILCCLFLVCSIFREDELERLDLNDDHTFRVDWISIPFSRDREDEDDDEVDGNITINTILADSSALRLHLEFPSAQQGELEFFRFPSVNNDPLGTSDFEIPPGYKFTPREEDLVLHYLGNYVLGASLPHSTIKQIQNLYMYDPDELPIGKSRRFLNNEIYLFTLNEAAYVQREVPTLATKTGYWRSRGNDDDVLVGGLAVGFKRTYIFYGGRKHGAEKTHWIMQEYRINPQIIPEALRTKMESFVVCKIVKRRGSDKKKDFKRR